MIINGINKVLATSDFEGVVDVSTFEERYELAHFVGMQRDCLKAIFDEETDETKFNVAVEFELGTVYNFQYVSLTAFEIADLLICGWKVTLKYKEGNDITLQLIPIGPIS